MYMTVIFCYEESSVQFSYFLVIFCAYVSFNFKLIGLYVCVHVSVCLCLCTHAGGGGGGQMSVFLWFFGALCNCVHVNVAALCIIIP